VLTVREAGTGRELARHTATLRTPKAADAPRSITYASRVDGSAQYIAIVPPKGGGGQADAASDGQPGQKPGEKPGLVLSLHGASVEATSQAAAYAPREGLLIACPTNRRPFGFDWEDWGRIDAIESMDEVARRFGTDPSRQYLTGHSMGGHGTWNIGVLHPERFAAIAPSAGWLSFDTYTSRGGPVYAPPGPLGDVFREARASSDTLAYFANLRGKGIYILHGDADDNVPVAQARQARAALDALGIAYSFHEQPGAGHWWDDDSPGGGAACVDWPGIWDMFAAHRLPTEPKPATVTPPLDERGFSRGAFKRVFDRQFVMVYGTGGTAAENAWNLAKARFDAEQWWYRGNGRAVVMADMQFNLAPSSGNVVLYGHADSNRAWAGVLGDDAPVHVARGAVRVGTGEKGRQIKGEDLAVLAVLPRARGQVAARAASGAITIEDGAGVGIIAGSGPAGWRATERLGYFTSGVGWPEVTILHAAAWRPGEGGGFSGVRAAGLLKDIRWRE
jgi:dienelactone hydrolase